jgi:hypothetical protein
MTPNRGNETPKLRTPPDTLEALRQVNACLRAALTRMQPEQNHCSAITPQDFSDLRGHIQRGADCVSGLGRDATPASQTEATAYRSHLENLQQFLPDLQGRMLAERSRLEAARDQVTATTAWVRASQKTI